MFGHLTLHVRVKRVKKKGGGSSFLGLRSSVFAFEAPI